MANRFRWSVLILAAAIAASGFVGCSSKTSKRQVVVYCSADEDVAKPILAEFTKKTGVKVVVRYDSEAGKTVGLAAKLRSEAGAPVADVFWSNECFHTITLAREGLLQGYEYKPAADQLAADKWPYVGKDRQWWGFAVRARAIAYDTRKVRPEDAPKSLEDLLDPRWKGKIAMAYPSAGTTGGNVASWFVQYGPDRAREILRALKANEVQLVGGNSLSMRAVADGQAEVALTDSDDAYAGQRNGWPIGMNYLDQGGAGVLAIPNTAAVVKGAPHSAEAAELMNFLLSAKVERMLAASDAHNTPCNLLPTATAASAATSAASAGGKYAIPHPLKIDYEAVAAALPAAIAASNEILRK